MEQESAILKSSMETLRFLQIWLKKGQTFDGGLGYRFKYFLLFISCSPLVTSSMIHLIVVLKDDLDVDLSEDFSIVSALIGLQLVLMTFIYHQPKIVLLIKHISNFETFGKPDNFDERSRQLNFYSKCFSYYCSCSIAIYALVSILDAPNCHKINQERGLNEICGMFVPAWAPFNIDYFPAKQIAFAIQVYGIFIIIKGGGMIAFTTFEVAENIVLRINHLNRFLREIFVDPNPKIRRERLNNCVRYHCYIISLHDLFDDCYKVINGYFSILTGAILGCIANQFVEVFSFVVFVTSLMQTFKKYDLGAFLHMGGWLVALYCGCHAGEAVLSAGLTIATAAVDSNWYEGQIDLQRDLLLLIKRSQIPLYLNASPTGIMSLALFTAMIKTSYSYFTLLNQSN